MTNPATAAAPASRCASAPAPPHRIQPPESTHEPARHPGGSPPIRIVVVDDRALFRRGVSQLLSMYPPTSRGGRRPQRAPKGIEAILTHRPGVALIDLHMKGLDGISVIRALQTAGSPARLVMLTVSGFQLRCDGSPRAGAAGYPC